MEKISYEEAREWFWVRTVIWSIPAMLVSIAAHFWYAGELDNLTAPRVWFAIGLGGLSVLLAIGSAALSMGWPWMRSGRWFGFVLTGPLCAAISAFLVFLLSGLLVAIIRDNVDHLPPAVVIDAIYKATIFAMAAAGFWSFIFGAWFALRRDRYFVEPI